MKKLVLISTLLLVCAGLYAQIQVQTYSEQIRTLRVLPQRAFLVLTDGQVDGSDADNTLYVSFDEMSHDVHFYTYTVRHLTADRSRESDLTSGEYVRGFTTQDITDYEHSSNTSREYTHYQFAFPNENMVLTKSGNYELLIYEDGNPDNRVAEVQFCVVEPLVGIGMNVRNNTDIELSGRYQQVDVDLVTAALEVRDPNEVKVLVRQNNRTDNQVWLTRPTFMERNKLRYINTKALIFEGGNEYHHFDAFSAYYAGTGIDRVYFQNGDYHTLLFADEVTQGQYIHQYDSDGRFVVNAERTNDPDTEAEYTWVYWTLAADKPWFDGMVYVNGEIFGNTLSMRNRMQYDNEAKCYWLAALVKQGGYDYQYVFVPKGKDKATTERVDGSYWQTENEYTVYVYWRPFGERYDRLVGLTIQKSTP